MKFPASSQNSAANLAQPSSSWIHSKEWFNCFILRRKTTWEVKAFFWSWYIVQDYFGFVLFIKLVDSCLLNCLINCLVNIYIQNILWLVTSLPKRGMAVKENLYAQVDTLIYLFKIHIPSLDQHKTNKSLMGSREEVHTHTHTHTHTHIQTY